jgi:hypothetical protein
MRALFPGSRPPLVAGLALSLIALSLPAARAADDRRVAAGTLVTETASLLRREAPDKPWQVVKEKEEVRTGDLLLGGSGGAVVSRDGGVRLAVVGDLDASSPQPVIETAFVLHEAKGADLDVTVDRGRLELVNEKKDGPAHVRLRVRDVVADVELTGPGSALALEVYGRWPRGVPFRKVPQAGEQPELGYVLLALKGEVYVKGPRKEFRLKAPPGQALLEGDTSDDTDPLPQHLDKLAGWAAAPDSSERAKKLKALMARWRRRAAEKSVGEAVGEMLNSDDPMARGAAVLLLAATDDLERLAEALRTTTHQDVWDAAVIALRHWIGRGPGQDQKLYQGLVEKCHVPPREAEGIMQLLHSFGSDELARPETYQVLINYLGSERTSLRELAYWHLARLAPAGRKLGYDPLAPKEKRAEAIRAWRLLIPPGKVPPREDGKQ